MIKEKIYEHFLNKEKNKERKESDKINFAPSYLTACKRQLFYKKTQVIPSNPIEDHSYIKFAMGDAVHEKIQELIKKEYEVIDMESWKEMEWQGLNWIYRVDGIINVNDKKYVIELKSTYFSGWQAIEHEAKKEHVLQLFLYMIFEKIDNGILLYIGRDNGLMHEYIFSIEQLRELYGTEIKQKIIELKELSSNIEHKIEPARDFKLFAKKDKNITFDFQKNNVKYKTDW